MTSTTVSPADLEALSAGWSVELIQRGRLEERLHKGKPWTTAIYKQPIDGLAEVNQYGIVGDEHTGSGPDLDRAICFHGLAHYAFWRGYFRREIPVGFFGENITLRGVVDEDLCVGDVVQCGSTLLQITQPRTPCYKQANKLGEPQFVKLILQSGRIGFLARVLQPGSIQTGDAFQLIERPCPQANLIFINRKLYDRDDRETAAELAELGPLAHDWKAEFAKIARGE
jgi:MOSC domain-containing protein YiiM